jgi:hypothetical protein
VLADDKSNRSLLRLLAAGVVVVALAVGAVAIMTLWGAPSQPKPLQLAQAGEPMQLAEAQAPKQGAPAPKQQPQQPPQPQAPKPAQIDRNGVLILIRETLLALDQANKTGNYTVLRDLGAPEFQNNTAARLAERSSPSSARTTSTCRGSRSSTRSSRCCRRSKRTA